MTTSSPQTRSLNWQNIFVTILGAAMLLLPAFINGYPLVNSDDGTYLHSGFIPEMPGDRPMAYGLFLRATSLNGLTLWLPTITQALIVSWLVRQTAQKTLGSSNIVVDLLLLTGLSFLTPLPTVVSQLLPDVFTPVALLSAALLVMQPATRAEKAVLWTLYVLSVASHISHVMIYALLTAGLWAVLWTMRRRLDYGARARRTVMALLVVACGLSVTMLKPVRSSSHGFAIAALLDQGILKPFLDERCPTENYALCKYKDGMSTDPNYFLWADDSPMRKEGSWEGTKGEYRRILRAIHSSPKWLWARVVASVRQTGRQVVSFRIGDGMTPFPAGSHVHGAVAKYVPRDERGYLDAVQQTTGVNLDQRLQVFHPLLKIVMILSSAVLALLLILRWRRLPVGLRAFTLFCLAGILVNAWNCGTFSNVLGRYGCRMMWLIPLCAMLCCVALWQEWKRTPTSSFSAQ